MIVNKADWPRTLPKIEHVLNNTIHSTTKELPSVLLFGVAQRSPETDALAEFIEDKNEPAERELTTIREQASEQILKSQKKNHEQFLKRNSPAETFRKGDFVAIKYVNTTPGVNKKLGIKYRGPYAIKEVLPHDRYIVSDVDGCQVTQIPYNGVLEANKLKKWVSEPSDSITEKCPREALTELDTEPSDTEKD